MTDLIHQMLFGTQSSGGGGGHSSEKVVWIFSSLDPKISSLDPHFGTLCQTYLHKPKMSAPGPKVYLICNSVLHYAITFSFYRTVFTGSVGSVLLHHFHWSTLFYFFGGLGLLWSVIVRYFSRHTRKNLVTIPSSSFKEDLKRNGNGVNSILKGFPLGLLCSKAPFW